MTYVYKDSSNVKNHSGSHNPSGSPVKEFLGMCFIPDHLIFSSPLGHAPRQDSQSPESWNTLHTVYRETWLMFWEDIEFGHDEIEEKLGSITLPFNTFQINQHPQMQARCEGCLFSQYMWKLERVMQEKGKHTPTIPWSTMRLVSTAKLTLRIEEKKSAETDSTVDLRKTNTFGTWKYTIGARDPAGRVWVALVGGNCRGSSGVVHHPAQISAP